MSLTEKQKANREGRVGSSDAAVIADVSPYKGVYELFCQFIGTLPRYTEEDVRYKRIGSLIEEPIARYAAEELNLTIRRAAPAVHPKYPFMSANIDFEIIKHPNGPGIMEVKNRGAAKPYDELPDDLVIQGVHQMAVKNREWVLYPILFGFGTFKTYELRRDRELEGYLIDLEARFMDHVDRNEPPDHTWTPNTVGLLKKLYPQDSGKTIELPEALNAIDALFIAKQELERAEQQKARWEGLLKSQMQDASVATIPGFGEITWKKTKDGTTFHEEQFKKDYPELYAQYQIPRAGYRRFVLKPYKEVPWLPTKSPFGTILRPEPDLPTLDPLPSA